MQKPVGTLDCLSCGGNKCIFYMRRSEHRCLVGKGAGCGRDHQPSNVIVLLFSRNNRTGAWHKTSQLHCTSQSPSTHRTKLLAMGHKPLPRQSLSETGLAIFMLFVFFPWVWWNIGIWLWQCRWGWYFKPDKETGKIWAPEWWEGEETSIKLDLRLFWKRNELLSCLSHYIWGSLCYSSWDSPCISLLCLP